MAGVGNGVSVEGSIFLGVELSSGFLFGENGEIYTLNSFDFTIGASWPPVSASIESYSYSGDAMNLNGLSFGYEQNVGLGAGIEFGIKTWNRIPIGLSDNNFDELGWENE